MTGTNKWKPAINKAYTVYQKGPLNVVLFFL